MGLFDRFKNKKENTPVILSTQPTEEKKTGRIMQAFSTFWPLNTNAIYTDINRTSRGYLDSPDGLYGNFLNNLYSASPIHGALINLKSMLTAGNGYTIEGAEDLNMSSKIQLNQLTNQFDNLIDNGLVLDYFIHNRVCILVTWNKDNTKIIKLKRINPASVNINTIDGQMEPIDYLYCWNWALFSSKVPVIRYPKFDQSNLKDKTQILMVQYQNPEQRLYSMPTYKGAIKSILTDKESDTHQLAWLKNAMSPSVVISFPFDLDEEEKADLIDGLRSDFTDTENAGKVFTTFSKTRDVLPSITQLAPLDVASGFLDLVDTTTRKICLGHGIDPQIIGLKTAGSLGNADFVYQYNLFNQGQIQPAQQKIQAIFNDFLAINGLSVMLSFRDVDINKLNPSVATDGKVIDTADIVAQEMVQEAIEVETAKSPIQVNDTIRQMSGRENQQMMRIIRQYASGKLNKSQASVLLSTSLGLSEEEITLLLTIEE